MSGIAVLGIKNTGKSPGYDLTRLLEYGKITVRTMGLIAISQTPLYVSTLYHSDWRLSSKISQ